MNFFEEWKLPVKLDEALKDKVTELKDDIARIWRISHNPFSQARKVL